MTVYVHYELACDHPDCFNAYSPNVEQVGSLPSTREGAKKVGWTRIKNPSDVGMLDRCPAHRTWSALQ